MEVVLSGVGAGLFFGTLLGGIIAALFISLDRDRRPKPPPPRRGRTPRPEY